jgi:HlyD family secretion protein
MQRTLSPAYAAADTLASYLAQSTTSRRPIYAACLAAVAAILMALPFVRVDVSMQARGLVRPATEKSDIRSPVSGRVANITVRRDETVARGAALLRVEAPELAEEMAAQRYRLQEVTGYVRDLSTLVHADATSITAAALRGGGGIVVTPRYSRELLQLSEELTIPRLESAKGRADVARAEQLHERGFLSDSTLLDQQQSLLRGESNGRLITERYRTRWQAELADYAFEQRKIEATLAQLAAQQESHVVVAPVAGTVEELASLAAGSFIQAGERLGVISPTDGMIAEIYVNPSDMAYVRVGMPVRVQVDAFGPSEWGMVRGRVVSVSDDFVAVNSVPMFRVQCSLERFTLRAPSGAIGHLRKGMTVRANFVLTRRSVFQLLRDDASDWLDPRFASPLQ